MKNVRKWFLLGALTFAVALPAAALDISDVRLMLFNNVHESVIINMVNNQGAMVATTNDIIELNAMGASPALLDAVSRASMGVGYSPTVMAPAPVVVAAPPPVIVTQPGPVIIQQPRRPTASFSFNFGNNRWPNYWYRPPSRPHHPPSARPPSRPGPGGPGGHGPSRPGGHRR